MDRLLRRHFRRDGETLRDRNAQESNSTAHMDADEMNAYAEGALPEAARSRYFAHLADCDSCRKLVTELTLASGAVAEEKRAAVAEPSPSKSWREWLAAIFSPPVLRYGVPALALFAVIIVTIVVMRARREEPSLAQNKEATRNSALSTSSSSNSPAGSSTETTSEEHASANSSGNNNAPATTGQSQTEIKPSATPTATAKAAEEEKASAPPPSVAAKTEAQSNSVLDKKQEDRAEEEAKSNNALAGTTSAPQPAASVTKPAPTGADDIAKRDEQRREKAMTKDADETVVVTNSSTSATTQTTAAESPRDRRVASRAAQSLPMNNAPKSAPSGGAVQKESSTETRTVGGHSFRRQGSAWVDTSFNPSRSAINIARGSEQYRALLADEPGLRTITQQLGGEVIVVWGNKAYRFH